MLNMEEKINMVETIGKKEEVIVLLNCPEQYLIGRNLKYSMTAAVIMSIRVIEVCIIASQVAGVIVTATTTHLSLCKETETALLHVIIMGITIKHQEIMPAG